MKRLRVLSTIALTLIAAAASAQGPRPAEASGELLYSTYCIGCHTKEVHWRQKRLATDWNSLKAEVRRSQVNTGIGLGEDDLAALARYLNNLFYRFPVTDGTQRGAFDPGRATLAQR